MSVIWSFKVFIIGFWKKNIYILITINTKIHKHPIFTGEHRPHADRPNYRIANVCYVIDLYQMKLTSSVRQAEVCLLIIISEVIQTLCDTSMFL